MLAVVGGGADRDEEETGQHQRRLRDLHERCFRVVPHFQVSRRGGTSPAHRRAAWPPPHRTTTPARTSCCARAACPGGDTCPRSPGARTACGIAARRSGSTAARGRV